MSTPQPAGERERIARIVKEWTLTGEHSLSWAGYDTNKLIDALSTPSQPVGEDAEALLERWATQLQAIGDKHGCEPGSNRIQWIADTIERLAAELAEERRLRAPVVDDVREEVAKLFSHAQPYVYSYRYEIADAVLPIISRLRTQDAETIAAWSDYSTISAKLYDREKAREAEQRACREAIDRATAAEARAEALTAEVERLNEIIIPGINAQLTEQFELSTKYVARAEALARDLDLAANRLQRCAVDCVPNSREWFERHEWAEAARARSILAKE